MEPPYVSAAARATNEPTVLVALPEYALEVRQALYRPMHRKPNFCSEQTHIHVLPIPRMH